MRSYQEMAGLPADGEADRALLEELRSVAELYGS
ncbi:MAG: peptidoglycan-binding domain-containing protein [Bacteroidota bacterium]